MIMKDNLTSLLSNMQIMLDEAVENAGEDKSKYIVKLQPWVHIGSVDEKPISQKILNGLREKVSIEL